MSLTQRQIFLQALEALLRPLARFCLRHSIKLQDFIEIAKIAFLGAAALEIKREGASVSTSRLSIITGLHRKDVMRLYHKQETKTSSDGSIAARVIGQWQQDSRFSNKGVKAKLLSLEGKNNKFVELVHSVSKDLNPYTVLFELERIGAVTRVGNNLRLDSTVYVPSGDVKQGLMLLASDMQDLILAVEENLFEAKELPNLHVKTQYDNICPEFIPEIRRWFLEKGAKFHEEARKFLSRFDKDLNPKLANKIGRTRAAVATFSFIDEDPPCETSSDELTS